VRLTRAVRKCSWPPLPGTRREAEAIAAAFRARGGEKTVTAWYGADASEPRVRELAESGRLKGYQYLHLATHGQADPVFAMRSALILSQDKLPDLLQTAEEGKPVTDGRLTAGQVLQEWELAAELVTLSACQSGLGRPGGGEGFIGFAQALFLAGARNVVVSLWEVDDAATALLMARFYENLLGTREGQTKPMPKAEALREAKEWLRGLPAPRAEE
jgi:CHAT domain-containing protein